MENLQQISMDGPNVNWSFFEKLSRKMDISHNVKLLNIGSCGIHTMHNAFKDGCKATNWEVREFLSALYIVFHDVPARREDLESVEKSSDPVDNVPSLFPKKCCPHRWLENRTVANRALELLPFVKKYVKAVQTNQVKSPGTRLYQT